MFPVVEFPNAKTYNNKFTGNNDIFGKHVAGTQYQTVSILIPKSDISRMLTNWFYNL